MSELILPWPPAACSPNARGHWSKRSKAAKAYRADCHLLCREALIRAPEGKALLLLEFVPPDRRSRDDDNLIAAFKSGRDGLADALGIDDRQFVTRARFSAETVKGGAVRVQIQSIGENDQ
ncbi:endodeoxyribonuclease RusA [Pseudomonas fluorescens]|uniref:endodeoxyribonuclease RusA n=1 Tax=Pseudomonas fluorescens TaxID=294 RepID=UPI00099DFF39|nr:endodeoxyribonuclease RusA [Pseudomonas fluorescens]OPB16719.1 endodeoxyribonuclease RusA [Pseudomonas fluorescens]